MPSNRSLGCRTTTQERRCRSPPPPQSASTLTVRNLLLYRSRRAIGREARRSACPAMESIRRTACLAVLAGPIGDGPAAASGRRRPRGPKSNDTQTAMRRLLRPRPTTSCHIQRPQRTSDASSDFSPQPSARVVIPREAISEIAVCGRRSDCDSALLILM